MTILEQIEKLITLVEEKLKVEKDETVLKNAMKAHMRLTDLKRFVIDNPF